MSDEQRLEQSINNGQESYRTMSKREHFAALALQGFLSSNPANFDGNEREAVSKAKKITIAAVALADMLLLSLEEVKP